MNNEAREIAQDSLTGKVPPRRVQIFRAGSFQFGVFEDEIATIADWREPTPLPHAPASVIGVVGIQGRMLTVMNLNRLTGGVSADDSYRYIIALRGDEQLALPASAIGEIVDYSHPDSENAKTGNESFVLGSFTQAGEETRILNVRQLFPAALQGRERRRRRF